MADLLARFDTVRPARVPLDATLSG